MTVLDFSLVESLAVMLARPPFLLSVDGSHSSEGHYLKERQAKPNPEDKSITIERKVNIVVFFSGKVGMIIDNIRWDPIRNLFPVIKIIHINTTAYATTFPRVVPGLGLVEQLGDTPWQQLGYRPAWNLVWYVAWCRGWCRLGSWCARR